MENQKQDIDWLDFQSIIQRICGEFDSQWQIKKRLLNTQFLVLFVLELVLSKNKQGYNSTLYKIWRSEIDKNIKSPQDKPIAASSICEAR